MKNTTYYLGAGASYHSLPLYDDFSIRLQVYYDYLFHLEKKWVRNPNPEYILIYLKDLNKLIQILSNPETSSVDSYAYELYSSPDGSMELARFKMMLSDFFLFEQLSKKEDLKTSQEITDPINGGYKFYDEKIKQKVITRIDKRYSNFINALINYPEYVLPKEVSIISWNYDLQLELTYSKIRKCSIDLSQQELQVYPAPLSKEFNHTKSSIIKLNGSAGIYQSKENNTQRLYNWISKNADDNFDDLIEYILENYKKNYYRIITAEPIMKFSFERDNEFREKTLLYAQNIIKLTKKLVIVGYQFHPTNRETDSKVLKYAPNLEEVVIQVKEDDYENVRYNLLKTCSYAESVPVRLYNNLSDILPPNNI